MPSAHFLSDEGLCLLQQYLLSCGLQMAGVCQMVLSYRKELSVMVILLEKVPKLEQLLQVAYLLSLACEGLDFELQTFSTHQQDMMVVLS